jgi:RNA polymerase sigma-70 factor (ECF subfamily)
VQKEIMNLSATNLNDNKEEDIIRDEEDTIRAEFYAEIHNAIKTLPPECRKIFTMLYIEGKTVRETADELGLARSTIKTQKARGLAMLRKKIRPYLYCILVAM